MDDNENMDLENLEDAAPAADAGEEMSSEDIDAAFAAEPVGGGAVAEEGGDASPSVAGLEAVYEIPVQISAVLGKSTMQVSQLLKLGRGAVVELDRKVGEAIDIYVNNRLVARGEVVVVNERLGVTMTEIIKAERG